METRLSGVDSLPEQAGLLSSSSKPAASVQEENDSLTAGFSSERAGSVTDLDADLLGVKLDDCSRYFKKEIMVSADYAAVDDFGDQQYCSEGFATLCLMLSKVTWDTHAGLLRGFESKANI